MLKFWESCLQNNIGNTHKLKIIVADTKRAIRKHNKRIEEIEDTKIIYSDTNGYFIELIRLPKFVTSLAEAEKYFDEELFLLRYFPQYNRSTCYCNCFTENHKTIQRGNRFYVYHKIRQDV